MRKKIVNYALALTGLCLLFSSTFPFIASQMLRGQNVSVYDQKGNSSPASSDDNGLRTSSSRSSGSSSSSSGTPLGSCYISVSRLQEGVMVKQSFLLLIKVSSATNQDCADKVMLLAPSFDIRPVDYQYVRLGSGQS